MKAAVWAGERSMKMLFARYPINGLMRKVPDMDWEKEDEGNPVQRGF